MRVVNRYKEAFTHDIGRRTVFGNRYACVKSTYRNITYVASRSIAIANYEADARKDPNMKAAIMALPEDAMLGCTCKPKDCHGDVIVKLWHEWHGLPYVEETKRRRLI